MNGDIELVIKISEEMYENIQSRDWKNGGRWFSEEWKAIHNGTPLPKGHGKIVDANRVLENGDNWEVETALMQTEAIIEADKESATDGNS